MSSATAVVPAAGRSSRFGGMKLLEPISGAPLLQHTLASLLAGGVVRITVVLAPGAPLSSVPLLSDPRVTRVVNAAPERGMFSSIQTGLATLDRSSDPVLVLPADMPFVTASTVAAVLAAAQRGNGVVVPVCGGRRGHPIALPASCRAHLLHADPVRSLRDALEAFGASWIELPVQDLGVLKDVDVRQDLDTDSPH
jgi:molybdenum cofactor cytidylyltransferase